MIKYQLLCDQSHAFEGWFQTSHAFDKQSADGLVACPICDSINVRRALMAPNLASPKRRQAAMDAAENASTTSATAPAQTPTVSGAVTKSGAVVAPQPNQEALAEALSQLRTLQRKVEAECRYVGTDFAEEARKIHYGEADPENIYGQSSPEECQELAEEGIAVAAIPWLPSEH